MSLEKYLKNQSYSPTTIKRYLAFEKELVFYFSIVNNPNCNIGKNKTIKDLNSKDLLSFIEEKNNQQLKRNSLQNTLSRIQKYYDYLGIENPIEGLELKGKKATEKALYLTEKQLDIIYQSYLKNPRLSLVSKVVLGLLIYQGLATFELPLLLLKNLDFKTASIQINPSRLAPRNLGLNATQIYYLQALVEQRKGAIKLLDYQGNKHLQNRHYHWTSQVKKELAKQKTKIAFQNLAQLRASRISLWIQQKGILEAQYLAGHQSISATQKYQIQDLQQLRSALQSLHPDFQ